MKAIRLRMRLDSTRLVLPELEQFLGKNIELIVLEEEPVEVVEDVPTLDSLDPVTIEEPELLEVGDRLLDSLSGPVELHEDLDEDMTPEAMREILKRHREKPQQPRDLWDRPRF